MTASLRDVDRSLEPAPREDVTNEPGARNGGSRIEPRAGSWIDHRDDARD